jgi:hypothetical protein
MNAIAGQITFIKHLVMNVIIVIWPKGGFSFFLKEG